MSILFIKKHLLLLILVASIIFSSPFVAAQEFKPGELISKVVTLQFLKDWGFPVTSDPTEGIIRFMIFILLFVLLFKGVEVAGLGKNASLIIALALSVATTIFVPSAILVAAATAYGTIFSLILVGLPIGIILTAYFFLEDHHWIRFVVMVFLIAILHIMARTLSEIGVSAGFKSSVDFVRSLMTLVIVFAYIMAVVSFVRAASSFGGASETRPNFFGRIYERIAQKTVLTKKGQELRHARIEETRLLSDLSAERAELNVLTEAIEQTKDYERLIHIIYGDAAVKSKNHLEQLNIAFDAVDKAMDSLNKAEHKWERSQRRESKEVRRLLKEMVTRGVTDKTRAELEEQKEELLNNYVRVYDSIKEAQKLYDKVLKAHDSFYKQISRWYNRHSPSDVAVLRGSPWMVMLDKFQDTITAFTNQLIDAENEENRAVGITAALAENFKKKWVV